MGDLNQVKGRCFYTVNTRFTIQRITSVCDWQRSAIQFLKRKYKNYKNIKFLGHLQNNEVLSYLKNAKFNLFGSKMYEGQPVVISEASSNNIPSVLPNNGGLIEFFS